MTLESCVMQKKNPIAVLFTVYTPDLILHSFVCYFIFIDSSRIQSFKNNLIAYKTVNSNQIGAHSAEPTHHQSTCVDTWSGIHWRQHASRRQRAIYYYVIQKYRPYCGFNHFQAEPTGNIITLAACKEEAWLKIIVPKIPRCPIMHHMHSINRFVHINGLKVLFIAALVFWCGCINHHLVVSGYFD